VNGKARFLGYLVATVVVVFAVFVLLAGCQKDKPVAGTQAMKTKSQAATPAPMKHEATPAPATQVAQAAEQTTCPVMGGPIDKNIFIEYQGKKVYFCCASCLDTFKANPEKYISKLPQFAK
jgi:YHS domain-containing protein